MASRRPSRPNLISRSETGSPVESEVVVRTPKRAVTSYSLSEERSCVPENFEASPKQIGSIPVARGSSAPV